MTDDNMETNREQMPTPLFEQTYIKALRAKLLKGEESGFSTKSPSELLAEIKRKIGIDESSKA